MIISIHKRAIALVALGLVASSTALAQSRPARNGMDMESLKSTYLACERAALRGELATGEIMLCSVIYEDVKQRAFGGDFAKLKAWADEHLLDAKPRATRDSAGNVVR